MKTALWELQKALIQNLRGNTTVSQAVNGIHDKTPIYEMDSQGNYALDGNGDKIPFRTPYIVIGEPTSTPHTTKTSFGENIVMPLHVWSRYSGKKEVYDIFNLILAALKEPLNIGGSFFMLRQELVNMNVLYDPLEDGMVHGIMELRYYMNN